MNRRSVLRGLAAFPIATALAGCHRNGGKDKDGKDDLRKPENHERFSGVRKLRVILMGPFAVVQQKDLNYRIKAYVPYDDEKLHEFRFPGPLSPGKKDKSYQFTLQLESLKTPGPAYVDSGFAGFNVELAQWKPPSDAFVSLDLPAPDVISFLPPPEGVLFEPSDQFPQGQTTTLPLNHVLEYTLKEGCDVKLHSDQLDRDATPLSCDDLHQQSIGYAKEHDIPESKFADHALMDQTITRCSQSNVCTYFLGVGLPPEYVQQHRYDGKVDDHALRFFNKKLLPSLYNRTKMPQGIQIVKLYKSPCVWSSGMMMSPALMPAVQRLPFPQARLVPAFASTENCTAPGATATSSRTLQ
jgi:hypothetical protein